MMEDKEDTKRVRWRKSFHWNFFLSYIPSRPGETWSHWNRTQKYFLRYCCCCSSKNSLRGKDCREALFGTEMMMKSNKKQDEMILVPSSETCLWRPSLRGKGYNHVHEKLTRNSLETHSEAGQSLTQLSFFPVLLYPRQEIPSPLFFSLLSLLFFWTVHKNQEQIQHDFSSLLRVVSLLDSFESLRRIKSSSRTMLLSCRVSHRKIRSLKDSACFSSKIFWRRIRMGLRQNLGINLNEPPQHLLEETGNQERGAKILHCSLNCPDPGGKFLVYYSISMLFLVRHANALMDLMMLQNLWLSCIPATTLCTPIHTKKQMSKSSVFNINVLLIYADRCCEDAWRTLNSQVWRRDVKEWAAGSFLQLTSKRLWTRLKKLSPGSDSLSDVELPVTS